MEKTDKDNRKKKEIPKNSINESKISVSKNIKYKTEPTRRKKLNKKEKKKKKKKKEGRSILLSLKP
jgi:hypothetical protein